METFDWAKKKKKLNVGPKSTEKTSEAAKDTSEDAHSDQSRISVADVSSLLEKDVLLV
jgi:hypothetical protein